MKSAAVFLDRDGTIIRDTGYVSNPEEVELLPGSAEAIRRFSEAGYLVVVASNQSGIARGLFNESDLDRVHGRVEELLAVQGASIDGAYYCPFLDGPQATVKTYRRDSELRKPKPGMLLQAARELNVDLKRSWMIGDSVSDVQAGQRAGCQTAYLQNGTEPPSDLEANVVVTSLFEAANTILGEEKEPSAHRPATPPKPVSDDRAIVLLAQIRETLERAQRPKRQDDFSLLRLGAALLQMFAVVCAFWGATALLNDSHAAASSRLALASFFQIAAVSAFVVDRLR